MNDPKDIYAQLCALLDQEGATYRVIEHAAEGRTELIGQIRGNRIEQSVKSMTLQVRLNRKVKISIASPMSLVIAAWILRVSKNTSMPIVSLSPHGTRQAGVDRLYDRGDPAFFIQ